MLRLFGLLVELLMNLGFPYGVAWVGGWFMAGSYLHVRREKRLLGLAVAAAALVFVLVGSYWVEMLPTGFEVHDKCLFVLLQVVWAVGLAAILIWARWVMLQRRTSGHIRLYAPLYLFPVFILGVVPYWWWVSTAGFL